MSIHVTQGICTRGCFHRSLIDFETKYCVGTWAIKTPLIIDINLSLSLTCRNVYTFKLTNIGLTAFAPGRLKIIVE